MQQTTYIHAIQEHVVTDVLGGYGETHGAAEGDVCAAADVVFQVLLMYIFSIQILDVFRLKACTINIFIRPICKKRKLGYLQEQHQAQ